MSELHEKEVAKRIEMKREVRDAILSAYARGDNLYDDSVLSRIVGKVILLVEKMRERDEIHSLVFNEIAETYRTEYGLDLTSIVRAELAASRGEYTTSKELFARLRSEIERAQEGPKPVDIEDDEALQPCPPVETDGREAKVATAFVGLEGALYDNDDAAVWAAMAKLRTEVVAMKAALRTRAHSKEPKP